MPRLSGIYVIANLSTGNVYVGSSSHIRKRLERHFRELRQGTHHSTYLQRAFSKYGADDFVPFVVEEVAPERKALIEREQHWIEQLHPAYNMNPLATSNLGKKVSEETKANLLRYAAIPHDEERRQKESAAQKAAWAAKSAEEREAHRAKAAQRRHAEASKEKMRRAKLGTKQSEETKRKRAESLKGRQLSEESRRKSSESNKAYWANMTEEQRQAFSEKARHRPPVSEETRRKQSEAAKARRKREA